MRRGEIWWAALPDPIGSEPGFRRPVLVVQSNEFNDSAIRTVIAVVITSNLKLVEAPGNTLLPRKDTRLTSDSVANVSQVITVDKAFLVKRVCTLSSVAMLRINEGLRLVLNLPG